MTSVLLALAGAAWEPALVAALPVGTGLRVARRCVDLDDLVVAGTAGAAPAALVAGGLPRLDRDSLARLAAAGVAVVGVAADDDDQRRLALLGAARVVRLDPKDPVATAALVARAVGDALEGGPVQGGRGYAHAAVRPSGEPAEGTTGPATAGPSRPAPGAGESPGGAVIAVWGPAGAPGRTSVAVCLADEVARAGHEVLLVDADTHAASVAALLGLPDDLPGLAAACRAAGSGRLDPDGLAALALPAAARWRVLTGLPRADRWPELRPAAMSAVLEVARATAEVVVVDVGPSLATDDEAAVDVMAPRRDGAALAAMDAADRVVAVAAAEPVGLLRFVPALAAVRQDWPTTPLHVVANRVRRTACGPAPGRGVAGLLSRHAGVDDAVLVPDDRPAFDAAVLAGRSLAEVAPRSPARAVLRALASSVLEAVEGSVVRG